MGETTHGKNIKRRIAAEPRYGRALYRILGDCLIPITLTNLRETIEAYPEMRVRGMSSTTLISWLVDVEALEKLPFSESQESNADQERSLTGSDELSKHGESFKPKGAEISFVTTVAGAEVWREYERSSDLEYLLGPNSPHAAAYRHIIELCKTPQSSKSLERELVEQNLLDLKKRQVSSYLDKLEKAEGLVWDKGWKTTLKAEAQIN